MCHFMGLPAFAPDALLRFQLRTALKRITSDDKDILWEGVHSLNEDELRQVTRTRTRARTRALTRARALALALTLSLSPSLAPLTTLPLTRQRRPPYP